MVSERKALYTLATDAPTDYVVIDGQEYPVADPDANGLVELVAQQRLEDRIVALEKIPQPTDLDETEYVEKLRELMRRIVPTLPPEVLDKLQPGHMTGLAAAFIVRRARSSASTPPANGSPASPASTAEATGS